jgi:hypothetical protein
MNKKMLIGTFAAIFIVTLAIPIAFACEEPSFCFQKWICGAGTYVPTNTPLTWYIHFEITAYSAMQDVTVKDNLGAELGIVLPPYFKTPGTNDPEITYSGATQKVHLLWDVGDLNPGDHVELIIEVYTDINPGGQQEYTSCGCYALNSGATLKFKFNGVKYSATTDPIYIYAY